MEALEKFEAYDPRDPTDRMLSAVPGRVSLFAAVEGLPPREASERRLVAVDGRGPSYLRR